MNEMRNIQLTSSSEHHINKSWKTWCVNLRPYGRGDNGQATCECRR